MADRAELEAARSAKRTFTEFVRGRLGIAGVGIGRSGDGRYEVQVFLTVASAGADLPQSWQGLPVHAQLVGPVRTH